MSTVFLLLLTPFIAMQFTQEVNWNIGDFIVASILLFGVAFGIEFILRIVKQPSVRMALITTTLLTLLVVWGELAVGLF